MAPSTRTRPKLLPNLTSIRIFAAGYVLFYHLLADAVETSQAHWYDAWRNGGYLGVTLFFILSGFILAYNSPPVIDKYRFYVLRFARVYPLYLVALLLALPNYLLHAHMRAAGLQRWVALPASLLLLQTWLGPKIAIQINSPSWSLSTEALFYAVFPFVLPGIVARMSKWKTMLCVLAILAILPSSLVHIWEWSHGMATSTDGQLQFMGLPLFRVPEFLIGVVIGRLFLMRMPVTTTLQVVASTTVAVACILVHGHIPFDIVRSGLVALPFGWMLYTVAGWDSCFLGSKAMQLLGEISYGVYLLQIPLEYMVNQLHLHQKWQWKLAVAVSVFPAAYLMFRLVERPGRLLLLRWFGIRSHPNPIEILAAPKEDGAAKQPMLS